MRKSIAILLVTLAMPLLAVELGAPFSDGAVLQRGRRIPVWGTARPSERVEVEFAGQSVEVVADESGAWRAELDDLEASFEGRVLKVTAGSDSKDVSDVLVGEVWFCAGQSNCDCTLWGENPHFRDAKGATRIQLTRRPLVRIYKTPSAYNENPQMGLKKSGHWKKFLPNAGIGDISAMGAYFAFELEQALGVPIGIVQSAWSGTPIIAWMRHESFSQKSLDWFAAHPSDEPQCNPSRLWNAMVAPWAPMAMRGIVWCQGEADSWRGLGYAKVLHSMYDGWKRAFENEKLMILVAQSAPHANGGDGWATLQEAQQLFAREEPNAEIAIISDRGNLADYHPADKETLAQRLALLALRYGYGFSDIKARSPTVRDAVINGDKVTLSFNDAEGWYLYNADWTLANGFEIAGADGKFNPCEILNFSVPGYRPYKNVGVLRGNRIELRAEGVERPTHVRYLHARPWTGNLFNEVGLPLGPFEIGITQKESGCSAS